MEPDNLPDDSGLRDGSKTGEEEAGELHLGGW